MEYSVYLAGPIKGLGWDSAVDWRKAVRNGLPKEIVCYSPMRYKEFLKSEEVIDSSMGLDVYDRPLTSSVGIKFRDKMDVRRSDLLLVNFVGAEEKSIGTTWEIGFAEGLNKPVLIAMQDEDIHNHPFIVEGNLVVPSLAMALELVPKILMP